MQKFNVFLDERQLCDLELLLNGGLSPLQSYMTRDDYKSVLKEGKLSSGYPFPIPVCLHLSESLAKEVISQKESLLLKHDQTIVATLKVDEFYYPDLEAECISVYKTTENEHPGIQTLKQYVKPGVVCVTGILRGENNVPHFDFLNFRLTPSDVKLWSRENNFKAVVAFQTRNPLHRSHVEVILQALEQVEQEFAPSDKQKVGLLIHPTVGPTQPGDIDYRIRIRCYKETVKLLPEHIQSRTLFAVLPLAMRMAGPKEAIWHGLIRANFGCTHFIVGRDPASPSAKSLSGAPYYDPYDAHRLCKLLEDNLPIKTVCVREVFYSPETKTFVREAPQDNDKAMSLSGTELRRRLQHNEEIPEWFSYPTVVSILRNYYQNKGICLWFTGLSGSGKSTIAKGLVDSLRENQPFGRTICSFDGDEIRAMYLGGGSGFSPEDRMKHNDNVARLASKVVNAGGIAICSLISPFQSHRDAARKVIESTGAHFIEIYVDTPLEVCRLRDVKGLYSLCEQGKISQFTGVSSPYEIPQQCDVTLSHRESVLHQVNQILQYMQNKGMLSVHS